MKKAICTFIMVCLIILTFTACNNQKKTIIEDKGEPEAAIPVTNNNEITPRVTGSDNETLTYEQIELPNNFEEKAYEHVKKIASFGIREAGSDAEAAADKYIMECLKQNGIEAVKEKFDFKYYNPGKVSINGEEISYDKICFNPYEHTKLNGKGEIFDKSKDQSNKIVILQGQETSIFDINAKTILNINKEDFEWVKNETSIQVDINGEIEKRISYNVIATINSTRKDAKSIIISAHMDSINGQGADDNASGVGVALELAKYYASIRNSLPYNIKFIFYGAEELGLLGAQAYISEHAKELSACALMFNIDEVGGNQVYIEAGGSEQKNSCSLQAPITNLYAITDYESKWFNKEFDFSCKLPDWLLKNIKDCCNELNYAFNSGNGMGSDHQIFARYGIPATNIAIVDEDIKTHTPEDTADKINPKSLLKAARIVTAVVNKTMNDDNME
jgi:hypothetical protein